MNTCTANKLCSKEGFFCSFQVLKYHPLLLKRLKLCQRVYLQNICRFLKFMTIHLVDAWIHKFMSCNVTIAIALVHLQYMSEKKLRTVELSKIYLHPKVWRLFLLAATQMYFRAYISKRPHGGHFATAWNVLRTIKRIRVVLRINHMCFKRAG